MSKSLELIRIESASSFPLRMFNRLSSSTILAGLSLFILLFFTSSCKSSPDVAATEAPVKVTPVAQVTPPAANTKNPRTVRFVDSTEASRLIITDSKDGFFETITALDMHIQMKNPAKPGNRNQVLPAFKKFLQGQVSNYNEAELSYLAYVLRQVEDDIYGMNHKLLPKEVLVAKIKTGHYGPDVFYTRENTIFFPEDALAKRDTFAAISVMKHEFWHIISRYNPELKEKAFACIGFVPLGTKAKIPAQLESKALTNPDGVSRDYVIELDGKKYLPFITSDQPVFKPEIKYFFNYIFFDLYEVDNNGNVSTKAIDKSQGDKYFEKITDNTQYVIHPDEIMADNFILAIRLYKQGDLKPFSNGGIDLMKRFLPILLQF